MPSESSNEIEQILIKTLNAYYDYITEKDIIKAAEEYSDKTLFHEAVAQIQTLINQRVVEELKALHGEFLKTLDDDMLIRNIEERINYYEGKK